MIRKDRRGIAITKGSKRHKITFRDELDAKVVLSPKVMKSTQLVAPKTLNGDMSNFADPNAWQIQQMFHSGPDASVSKGAGGKLEVSRQPSDPFNIYNSLVQEEESPNRSNADAEVIHILP